MCSPFRKQFIQTTAMGPENSQGSLDLVKRCRCRSLLLEVQACSQPRSPAHPHSALPGKPVRTHCLNLTLLQETSAGALRGRKEIPPEAGHTAQRQRQTYSPGRPVRGCAWLRRRGWRIRPGQVARAMFMRLVARLPNKPE